MYLFVHENQDGDQAEKLKVKTENKGEKKREKETSIKERSFRQTSDKTFKIRHGCKYASFHGRARTDIIMRIPIETQPPSTL